MTTDIAANAAVIIAIGEVTDRPVEPAQGREPVALMAEALRAADHDGGGGLLEAIDSVEVVGQISWRYRDPAGLLCERLGLRPARKINASMGGETPLRLIHEAALRVARGDGAVTAVVGAESLNALAKARKARIRLDWTPMASREEAVHVAFDTLPIGRSAKAAGVTDPVHVYPLYENATQAAKGETPRAGLAVAAALWARFSEVAAGNPYAWRRSKASAEEIATVSGDNRMVSYPYPKLMVANPQVNQAAAVIVTTVAHARALGIAEARMIHLWGGAAAEEPADFLLRDRYDQSVAQQAVLREAVRISGGGGNIGLTELYSCFPIVPRLAREQLDRLGVPATAPTVTGGLTFFGGPLNNYMTHAVCAMVRRLRDGEAAVGLLYGQGGVVSKHHALVVSRQKAPAPLAAQYSVQAEADAAQGPVPPLAEGYAGPATVETHTVIHGPLGDIVQGVVVARTPDGSRLIAKVRDDASIARLMDPDRSPVGLAGEVWIDSYDAMAWSTVPARERRAWPRKFCFVERDGRLTIVTINRPEAMNALHPRANEELAEIFDAFQADPEQWVAILTGAGDKAFSAGNDLKFTAEAMARGQPIETPATGFAGLTSRWDLTKPVIAAVNGAALGGGFEIALACDLIIAARTAVFALPEPKVGLVALAGGLHRLPAQIGLKRAMGMILTGRRVSAEEGQAMGFVNEVVAPAELMAAARRWADQIMACSPMAVRASKDAVTRGANEATLRGAHDGQLRYPAVSALLRSGDIREGPLAFAQKRAPNWKGK